MDEREKIEKVMQVENMNSAQFAMEIGIQGSTLSHILNGRNKPSLDVLKKILKRFQMINPDWLILDVGTMYRQEKQSQVPTLFDNEDESDYKSNDYTYDASALDSTMNFSRKNEDVNNIVEPPVQQPENENQPEKIVEKVNKSVKKIIVYYTDNTFEEFDSLKSGN